MLIKWHIGNVRVYSRIDSWSVLDRLTSGDLELETQIRFKASVFIPAGLILQANPRHQSRATFLCCHTLLPREQLEASPGLTRSAGLRPMNLFPILLLIHFFFPIINDNLEHNHFSVPCKSLQWSWVCLGKMFSYAWLGHYKDVWFGKYHVNKILFRVFPSMGIIFCLFYLSFIAHSFSRPSSFNFQNMTQRSFVSAVTNCFTLLLSSLIKQFIYLYLFK